MTESGASGDLLEKLAQLVRERRSERRPFVVGVTGMDTSGKSVTATLLAEELLRSGLAVQIIRLDDFHRPSAERHREELSEQVQYYEYTFDLERLKNEVLAPIRDNGKLETSLICLDLQKDTWTIEQHYSVNADTIVLLEGVFLFRPEIAHFLDLVIFLEVDEATVMDRARSRDVPIHGEEIMRKYQSKYLPAQRAYLDEYPSERNADVIIDNNDWENPIVIKWKAMG